MSYYDAVKLRELAAREDVGHLPEYVRLIGVLCYCADEIDRYRAALSAITNDHCDDVFTPAIVAGDALAFRTRLDAAIQEFPPALAAWGREAFVRRAAFLERECLRKDVEIAQLKLMVEEKGNPEPGEDDPATAATREIARRSGA